jgi:hypothetical protein
VKSHLKVHTKEKPKASKNKKPSSKKNKKPESNSDDDFSGKKIKPNAKVDSSVEKNMELSGCSPKMPHMRQGHGAAQNPKYSFDDMDED